MGRKKTVNSSRNKQIIVLVLIAILIIISVLAIKELQETKKVVKLSPENIEGEDAKNDIIDTLKKLFGVTEPPPPIGSVCPTMNDFTCGSSGAGYSYGENRKTEEAEKKALEACSKKDTTHCIDPQDNENTDNQNSCENSPAQCSFSSELINEEECTIRYCRNYDYVGLSGVYDYKTGCSTTIWDICTREGGEVECERITRDIAICNEEEEEVVLKTEQYIICVAYKSYDWDHYECTPSGEDSPEGCTGEGC